MTPEPDTPAQPQSTLSKRVLSGGFVGLGLFYLISFALGGELQAFAEASLETAPFAVLAFLAYLGAKNNVGKLLTILWLLLLVFGIAGLALSTSFAAIVDGPLPPAGSDTPPQFIQGGLIRLLLVGWGMAVAILVGGLVFVNPVRRWLTNKLNLPLDPDSFVHTIALSSVLTLMLMTFAPLIFLGTPPFLTIASNMAAEGQSLSGGRDSAGLLRGEMYGLMWLLPGAFLAVGYGLNRNFSQVLARLGLQKPTAWQVVGGLGLAFLLVLAVTGLDWLISIVWGQFNWPRTDNEAFGLVFDFALSPIGAVVIGITAGLGEEVAVRGVLQPRMGIILSNLLFTSLHALQYNWDGLLVVFSVGLILGLVRKASNTTTCAIIHGVYNFSIIMAGVLGLPGFS